MRFQLYSYEQMDLQYYIYSPITGGRTPVALVVVAHWFHLVRQTSLSVMSVTYATLMDTTQAPPNEAAPDVDPVYGLLDGPTVIHNSHLNFCVYFLRGLNKSFLTVREYITL